MMRYARPMAAAALIALLAGCGSAAAHGVAAPATPAGGQVTAPARPASTAPDPAAIVRQAGAVLDQGDSYDISGDRMASGLIHSGTSTGYCGEQITVYTNDTNAALEQLPLMTQPGGQAVIGGDRFVISVTGVDEIGGPSPGTVFYVSPATIAHRVHGTVIIPASGS